MNSLLGEVRSKLGEIYQNVPKTTYEKLMLAYVAFSNRDLVVALKQAVKTIPNKVQGVTITSSISGNAMSLQEIAHGVVDGWQPAIRMCQRNIDNNQAITSDNTAIDILDFIKLESALSNLYASYEHLWQCILWSGYKLEELDRDLKYFRITQPLTSFEIQFEASIVRKERLSSQKTMIAYSPELRKLYIDDKFVRIKRQSKIRVAYEAPIKSAGDKLITWNTQWRIQVIDIMSYFPKKWLEEDHGSGFSILEALEVMRCLMLMANSCFEKFPEDDSAFNLNKLMEFCPRVSSQSLRFALKNATRIEHSKIAKILAFLTATSNQTSDLWCEPLIKVKNEYAILLGALAAPSINRLVEHWFTTFQINLEKKGYTYEESVVNLLNKELYQNPLIEDFDEAIGKRIKLDTEEEFDLLARIEDLIIIGESKSIVTTDSPISKYRTTKILEHAGEQVIRKTKFFKDNIERVFDKLGWNFDSNAEYKFAQCIVNSSQVLVGHKSNGIPVIDEKILKYYFESSKIRILSVPTKDGEHKDLAWYELYRNIKELKDNFETYLCNPPQLNEDEKSFEYRDLVLPYLSENSYKVVKRRLSVKQEEPLAIMRREHKFRVIKSADYESEAPKITVTI
ncbi:hypothetical protein Q4493_16550 [Colwellia sp. 1_MG-2023]|uniref:hypothetical protein n=1 Tax=Colwellia sp. 1_MG-2023 TaxID=3062649 RepID=UPI0026E11EED|nr:hypothetical protein [Colwellia sp. 1_MG-2023]MDO6447383.1 hypothetical protein [Colwellia sp. 1_MG-2023]